MLEELAGLGFSQVELGHGIRYSLWPGILKAVEKGTVEIVSLHNFCPLPMGFTKPNPNCFEFSDPRESVRKRALRCSRETVQQAAELGGRKVVLHLGSTGQPRHSSLLVKELSRGRFGSRSFVRTKLEAIQAHEDRHDAVWRRVRGVLDELVPYAAEKNVQLGCECREEIEEFPMEGRFPDLLAVYPGETLGYWHDFGHAARKAALGFVDHLEHLKQMARHLVGCHIHDFIFPNRDHRPLGTGTIDFPPLLDLLPSSLVPTLELSPRVSREEVELCLRWWKNNAPEKA